MSAPEIAVPLLHGARFNDEQTRFAMPTEDGYACYRRASTELGTWRGFLDGIAPTEMLAQRFLNGEEIALPRR